MPKKIEGLTAVTVSLDAADELRTFAAHAGGQLGERVTLDRALRLAIEVASKADAETLRGAQHGRA